MDQREFLFHDSARSVFLNRRCDGQEPSNRIPRFDLTVYDFPNSPERATDHRVIPTYGFRFQYSREAFLFVIL
jgi:hypothetical protein